jgi:hypothetical protein
MDQLTKPSKKAKSVQRLLPEKTDKYINHPLPGKIAANPVFHGHNMPPEPLGYRKGKDNDCL